MDFEKTHKYNTRHSFIQNYFLPQKITELGKKSFSFIGPYIWRKIPLELKGLPLSKFKTKLKQHLDTVVSIIIEVSLDMI